MEKEKYIQESICIYFIVPTCNEGHSQIFNKLLTDNLLGKVTGRKFSSGVLSITLPE